MEENNNINLDNKPQEEKKEVQNETETPEQINWKKFREERAKQRKAQEEAEQRAKKAEEEREAFKLAMEALVNKPNASVPAQQEYQEPTEDDRIQRKIEEALERDRRKQEQLRAEQEKQELPAKLTQTYKDFDKVCSAENLDYLEYHYPEVANAFSQMPNNFNKWSNVYHAVKRFLPNPDPKTDIKKLEKNLAKPQSMSVGGPGQTGDLAPHKLDEQKKQDNWTRMKNAMKGL